MGGTYEEGTAAPERSVKRIFGKLCQLVARKMPLIPGKVRVLLQRVNGVHFVDWHSVFLGEDVFFDDIYPENIFVGRNVRITAGVRILTHYFDTRFQPTPERPFRFYQGKVHIGDNVFIGVNTVIVKPVKIGEGSVIGANSVVTRDIPANAIAVGSPARVVGMRPPMKKIVEIQG
ncbi:acyltransferase [Methylococcus geothermalis]|uniref:Acyltransferase n=1 Tax=Methylococcus geothermalis TaxID=2681310 RepID=A0A858Q9V6_9GAMM|nr:acyltransferase [Methylococcus geothermalis]QJD30657.1 acyltransferase [Methylococcus geothermalis]